uniref:COMM domain-containing protein 6 n=1 Tax=Buteo japonicus TaxID=224669 RepID=A0A8C0B3G0_9AVES
HSVSFQHSFFFLFEKITQCICILRSFFSNKNIKWKLGVAMSSDTCRSLKYPYVTVTLKVADPSGQITDKSFEMTVPQFKNFFRQFKEMAAVLETV